jgi:hypothetical protein
LDPPNSLSVRFHEKSGFKKVLQIKPSDRILRGVRKREADIGEANEEGEMAQAGETL